jgi:glycosyltransferase involved in cell wall biosynthesis
MPSPLVSVIVPVWNMSRYLGDALRSVFSQDYRPLEVIGIRARTIARRIRSS